jgi:hypothetical protein
LAILGPFSNIVSSDGKLVSRLTDRQEQIVRKRIAHCGLFFFFGGRGEGFSLSLLTLLVGGQIGVAFRGCAEK